MESTLAKIAAFMRRKGTTYVAHVELAGAGFSDAQISHAVDEKILRLVKIGTQKHTWQYKLGSAASTVTPVAQPAKQTVHVKPHAEPVMPIVEREEKSKPANMLAIFVLIVSIVLATAVYLFPAMTAEIAYGAAILLAIVSIIGLLS